MLERGRSSPCWEEGPSLGCRKKKKYGRVSNEIYGNILYTEKIEPEFLFCKSLYNEGDILDCIQLGNYENLCNFNITTAYVTCSYENSIKINVLK